MSREGEPNETKQKQIKKKNEKFARLKSRMCIGECRARYHRDNNHHHRYLLISVITIGVVCGEYGIVSNFYAERFLLRIVYMTYVMSHL